MRMPRGLIFAVLLLALWTQLACRKQRRPDFYIIPDGYKGWVKIQYKVKEAPPLPIEGDHYLILLDRSGSAVTSSAIESGFATDEFYYVRDSKRFQLHSTPEGGKGQIWGEAEQFQGNEAFTTFFVGTDAEYRAKPEPPEP